MQSCDGETMNQDQTELFSYLTEGAKKILRGFSSEKSFWRKILSVIGEPLFIVDSNKRIVFFNKLAEQVTGFSQDEVLGQYCLSGIRCENCLRECALFEDGTVESKDIELITKDGRRIQVVKNATTFTDENGNLIGGIEIFRDVTDERRLQNLVVREKERVERILHSIRDGVIAVNDAGEITFVNRPIEGITRFKRDELIGTKISTILSPALTSDFDAPELEDGVTTEILDRDGGLHSIELKVLSIYENSGASRGKMIILRLVTPSELVRKEMESQRSYHGIISNSPLMIEIFNLIETISDSDVTVLIEGESGTGKELLARAIHKTSKRSAKPFYVVNCAVFNENLLESELFGHCKGAFTGAVNDKIGRFEQADGGTIFLDEIGELPQNLQAKLLRFLQDREFERVGEINTRKVDVRIIAATNKHLQNEIRRGNFRDDLYYRLSVIPVSLPPLRERTADIPLLLQHYIHLWCEKKKIPMVAVSDEALNVLKFHSWPGNVRELENVILHALTCCDGRIITEDRLPKSIRSRENVAISPFDIKKQNSTVDDAERDTILEALRQTSFNRSKAAELLGFTRTTLWRKMRKLGLQP